MSETLTDLLNQAHRARRESRPDDADLLLAQAVALARETDDRHGLGRVLAALGQRARDRRETEDAIAHYEAAAAIARAEDDGFAVAHRLRHVGDLHLERDRYDLAEQFYAEALALYRSRPGAPPLDVANALRPMAIVHERRGDAAPLWREARDLYAQAGVEAGVAEATRRLDEAAGS
jgi:tetratricopeptide (TPR) repeat protein